MLNSNYPAQSFEAKLDRKKETEPSSTNMTSNQAKMATKTKIKNQATTINRHKYAGSTLSKNKKVIPKRKNQTTSNIDLDFIDNSQKNKINLKFSDFFHDATYRHIKRQSNPENMDEEENFSYSIIEEKFIDLVEEKEHSGTEINTDLQSIIDPQRSLTTPVCCEVSKTNLKRKYKEENASYLICKEKLIKQDNKKPKETDLSEDKEKLKEKESSKKEKNVDQEAQSNDVLVNDIKNQLINNVDYINNKKFEDKLTKTSKENKVVVTGTKIISKKTSDTKYYEGVSGKFVGDISTKQKEFDKRNIQREVKPAIATGPELFQPPLAKEMESSNKENNVDQEAKSIDLLVNDIKNQLINKVDYINNKKFEDKLTKTSKGNKKKSQKNQGNLKFGDFFDDDTYRHIICQSNQENRDEEENFSYSIIEEKFIDLVEEKEHSGTEINIDLQSLNDPQRSKITPVCCKGTKNNLKRKNEEENATYLICEGMLTKQDNKQLKEIELSQDKEKLKENESSNKEKKQSNDLLVNDIKNQLINNEDYINNKKFEEKLTKTSKENKVVVTGTKIISKKTSETKWYEGVSGKFVANISTEQKEFNKRNIQREVKPAIATGPELFDKISFQPPLAKTIAEEKNKDLDILIFNSGQSGEEQEIIMKNIQQSDSEISKVYVQDIKHKRKNHETPINPLHPKYKRTLANDSLLSNPNSKDSSSSQTLLEHENDKKPVKQDTEKLEEKEPIIKEKLVELDEEDTDLQLNGEPGKDFRNTDVIQNASYSICQEKVTEKDKDKLKETESINQDDFLINVTNAQLINNVDQINSQMNSQKLKDKLTTTIKQSKVLTIDEKKYKNTSESKSNEGVNAKLVSDIDTEQKDFDQKNIQCQNKSPIATISELFSEASFQPPLAKTMTGDSKHLNNSSGSHTLLEHKYASYPICEKKLKEQDKQKLKENESTIEENFVELDKKDTDFQLIDDIQSSQIYPVCCEDSRNNLRNKNVIQNAYSICQEKVTEKLEEIKSCDEEKNVNQEAQSNDLLANNIITQLINNVDQITNKKFEDKLTKTAKQSKVVFTVDKKIDKNISEGKSNDGMSPRFVKDISPEQKDLDEKNIKSQVKPARAWKFIEVSPQRLLAKTMAKESRFDKDKNKELVSLIPQNLNTALVMGDLSKSATKKEIPLRNIQSVNHATHMGDLSQSAMKKKSPLKNVKSVNHENKHLKTMQLRRKIHEKTLEILQTKYKKILPNDTVEASQHLQNFSGSQMILKHQTITLSDGEKNITQKAQTNNLPVIQIIHEVDQANNHKFTKKLTTIVKEFKVALAGDKNFYKNPSETKSSELINAESTRDIFTGQKELDVKTIQPEVKPAAIATMLENFEEVSSQQQLAKTMAKKSRYQNEKNNDLDVLIPQHIITLGNLSKSDVEDEIGLKNIQQSNNDTLLANRNPMVFGGPQTISEQQKTLTIETQSSVKLPAKIALANFANICMKMPCKSPDPFHNCTKCSFYCKFCSFSTRFKKVLDKHTKSNHESKTFDTNENSKQESFEKPVNQEQECATKILDSSENLTEKDIKTDLLENNGIYDCSNKTFLEKVCDSTNKLEILDSIDNLTEINTKTDFIGNNGIYDCSDKTVIEKDCDSTNKPKILDSIDNLTEINTKTHFIGNNGIYDCSNKTVIEKDCDSTNKLKILDSVDNLTEINTKTDFIGNNGIYDCSTETVIEKDCDSTNKRKILDSVDNLTEINTKTDFIGNNGIYDCSNETVIEKDCDSTNKLKILDSVDNLTEKNTKTDLIGNNGIDDCSNVTFIEKACDSTNQLKIFDSVDNPTEKDTKSDLIENIIINDFSKTYLEKACDSTNQLKILDSVDNPTEKDTKSDLIENIIINDFSKTYLEKVCDSTTKLEVVGESNNSFINLGDLVNSNSKVMIQSQHIFMPKILATAEKNYIDVSYNLEGPEQESASDITNNLQSPKQKISSYVTYNLNSPKKNYRKKCRKQNLINNEIKKHISKKKIEKNKQKDDYGEQLIFARKCKFCGLKIDNFEAFVNHMSVGCKTMNEGYPNLKVLVCGVQNCEFLTQDQNAFEKHKKLTNHGVVDVNDSNQYHSLSIQKINEDVSSITCLNSLCDFMATSVEEVKKHLETCKFGLPCQQCNYRSFNKDDLRRHESKHLRIKLTCNFCSLQFMDKEFMASHYETNHDAVLTTIVYNCKYCWFKSIKLSEVKSHFEDWHKKLGEFYECPICGSFTKVLADYQIHFLQHIYMNKICFK